MRSRKELIVIMVFVSFFLISTIRVSKATEIVGNNTLPYQVFLDIDKDGKNETAINKNNMTDDGFEVYQDPNHNTISTPIDADFDGMTDWLIQVSCSSCLKYWDPDDGILTNVTKKNYEYYIDTNGDNKTDVIYNSQIKAFIVTKDVDSDTNLEKAIDTNMDGSFENYTDTDGSSKLLYIFDGDNDNKNDFIIGIAPNITKPAKYWDPDNDILTDIVEKDLDGDGKNEYLIDVQGDGKCDKILNGNALHNLSDLTVGPISFTPTSPTEGDNVQINANIKNIGGYKTSNFTVELKLDDNFLSSKVISLAANESTDLEFIWYNAQSGSHKIDIIADSDNNITESNETNNENSTSIFVSSSSPQVTSSRGGFYSGNATFVGFPDKVEADIGDKIKLSGKFRSDLAYGLTNIEFSLESDGLDPTWYKILPTGYSRIDQEESRNVSVEITIPADAGIYTFYVKLKATADSQDGNKTFEKPFTLLLKERIVTTTTATTTIPETTTTTTISDEKPSPLTGFYAFIRDFSIPIIILIIIIIIIMLLKAFKVRFEFDKKGYIYGKGWTASILKLKFFSTLSLKTLFTKW